ncbi:MAG: hypothetical protein KC635_17930, partial [Myxococcales bacterium]|nr:hypothetical protein [Myxococcales bacterium]
MKRWISVMGLVGMMSVGGALSGCDAGTPGGAPVAVAIGDLDGLVSSANARLELTIAAGGAVKTIAASRELGHDEHVEGQVVAIDAAARTLELADVGTVRWTAGSRLRTREESRAAEQAWVAEVAGGLARGESVRVRADRAVTSPVAAPTATEFGANDLRIESPRAGAKLEIVVTEAHLSDDGATLVFLGRSHDLGGATLRVSDDMARELEVGDDHGGHGEAEPGDDNGG